MAASNRMKIDFWLPHLKIAGGTKITLTYASELAERGHRVRVFVPRTSWRDRMARRGTWKGMFPVKVTYVHEWKDACRDPGEIIIADSWQVATALAMHAPTSSRLYEFVQHDERLFHGNPEEVEKIYREPRIRKIVVATWLKELFTNEFGIDTELIMNTLDRHAFFPTPAARNAGTVRILLLVHTYPWKGTKEGIATVATVKKNHKKIELIGFGIRQKDAPPGLDRYEYNPSQARLRELYASADIFLCPSWVEGFGLPSLEAMACGAVVVTYENDGSRDFAINDVTALVAVRKDVHALAAKLETAVTDMALRARISAAGVRFTQALPSWNEQAARLEKVLAQ